MSKHTAKRLSQGWYEYRGLTVLAPLTKYGGWEISLGGSVLGSQHTLRAAKEQVDFWLSKPAEFFDQRKSVRDAVVAIRGY